MENKEILKRPDWIKAKYPSSKEFSETLKVVKNRDVYTVCEEALCPNISECWKNKTATFLIFGNICTRRCGFCNIKKGTPLALDEREPNKIAEAIKELDIKYAVITSVTRDDLKDGGASHFSKVIKTIKNLNQETKIEILTPDFKGDEMAIKTIVDAAPDVFGHNMEVVRKLHKIVKKKPADYDISLDFLKKIKKIKPDMITKTGIMIGVGEKKSDVFELISDAIDARVDIMAIGQYLTPSTSHYPVVRYVSAEEFEEYKEYGEKKGIKVVSGPLVRSSYKAREVYNTLCHLR
ncbi:MAG: lipoyl synthase [Holosporales bacterium]|jgi:lipoic acid synthetase|nr:lipoyl synthase [Holosporales bacterium]